MAMRLYKVRAARHVAKGCPVQLLDARFTMILAKYIPHVRYMGMYINIGRFCDIYSALSAGCDAGNMACLMRYGHQHDFVHGSNKECICTNIKYGKFMIYKGGRAMEQCNMYIRVNPLTNKLEVSGNIELWCCAKLLTINDHDVLCAYLRANMPPIMYRALDIANGTKTTPTIKDKIMPYF
jgi:hypothetical protein